MSGRLQDKVAIITGAESGIGQATAIAFAKEGADVVIGYHSDAESAEETRKAVVEAGRAAIAVRCDHTDPADVDRLFSSAKDAFGVADILVNSAGIDAPGDQVAEMTDETWHKVIDTDLYGPFACCRAFIKARREVGGRGRIVNVSSVH